MSNQWDDLIDKRHPRIGADGKPIVAAAATASAPESEADVAKRVQAEALDRYTGIATACDLAGVGAERIASFVSDSKMTVSAVLALLAAEQKRALNGTSDDPIAMATRARHAARLSRRG
jgi:hypothetical protein